MSSVNVSTYLYYTFFTPSMMMEKRELIMHYHMYKKKVYTINEYIFIFKYNTIFSYRQRLLKFWFAALIECTVHCNVIKAYFQDKIKNRFLSKKSMIYKTISLKNTAAGPICEASTKKTEWDLLNNRWIKYHKFIIFKVIKKTPTNFSETHTL